MINISYIIKLLREKVPPKYWDLFWLLAPTMAIILLPLGLVSTYLLSLFGFEGVGRLNQLILLFSIFFGILIGIIILLSSNKLELSPHIINKVNWLARFAVVTPLLSVLFLFLIFSK